MKKNPLILGIETSCDETAASIIQQEKNGVKILSNVVSSQTDVHKKFGGGLVPSTVDSRLPVQKYTFSRPSDVTALTSSIINFAKHKITLPIVNSFSSIIHNKKKIREEYLSKRPTCIKEIF